MNRLQRPAFFNDDDAIEALANNPRVGSHPHLQAHIAAIQAGYAQYIGANGDATKVAAVALPDEVGTFLRGHYGQPPTDIAHIRQIRRESGVATCPMCGAPGCGTLDHILPKTSHPAFAVFGQNLVPACKCNSLRGEALVGPDHGERILHPYFDDVLSQRLLVAQFAELGPVPRVSVRLLLAPAHPQHAAAAFHVRSVVERTQVRDHLRRTWGKLVKAPSLITPELRDDPPTKAALREILERELDRSDRFYDSKNSWHSIFMAGLLDEPVVDWLFAAFGRPGRGPDGPLVA